MINAEKYARRKSRNMVVLTKTARSEFLATYKAYDPETGTLVDADTEIGFLQETRNEKQDTQAKVQNIQTLIDDMVALG